MAYCQSIGGALVSINSEIKNEFITHLLGMIYLKSYNRLVRSETVLISWSRSVEINKEKLMEWKL